MKKLLILLPILSFVFLPLVSFGAVSYSRSPSGYIITSPISVDVSVASTSDIGLTTNYWGIHIVGENTGSYNSSCVASSTLSLSDSLILAVDDYNLVEFQGHNVEANCENGTSTTKGTDIEGNGIIFVVSFIGEAIDDVSRTVADYFTVLIMKFWPFLLGATLLLGVIMFGIIIINAMWRK